MAGYPVGFSGPKIDEALNKILNIDVTENGCIKLMSSEDNPLDLDTAIYPGYFLVEYYKSTSIPNLPFSHRPLLFYNYQQNSNYTVQVIEAGGLVYMRDYPSQMTDFYQYSGHAKIKIGVTPPAPENLSSYELWIDVTDANNPVLMVYDYPAKRWVELLSPDLLRKSIYDSQGRGTDIFKYIDDKIAAADVGTLTEEFAEHIADAAIHVTAEQIASWNSKTTAADVTAAFNALDSLIQTYVTNAASGSLTTLANTISTGITTLTNTLSTHAANTTIHPTAAKQTAWDSKAEGDHVHRAGDGKGTEIAVGNRGTILRSTDNGLTWTNITVSGVTTTLSSIYYSNNTWIAVGGSGTILRSIDNGLTWTKITVSVVSGYLYNISYGNNTWIAVGYDSTSDGTRGVILRSTDDGLTWTKISEVTKILVGIHYSNNIWIIVGSNGIILRSTDDGLTWTQITVSGVSTTLQDVYYSNNTWIAVGYDGGILRTTDDGLTWTKITVSEIGSSTLYNIYYGNNIWIAVGLTGVILRSTDDGLTWTKITVSGVSGNTLQGLHYSNNTWLIVSDSASMLRSIDNGLTWTKITVSGTRIDLNGIYGSITIPAVQIDASNIVSGEIDDARIPYTVYFHAHKVATDAERFKLDPTIINNGDSVYVESTYNFYYVTDNTKLSTEAGYMLYSSAKAMSVEFSAIVNKPTTLAGYGITDGATKTYVDNQITPINTSLDVVKKDITSVQSTVSKLAEYTSADPTTLTDLQTKVNQMTADASLAIIDAMLIGEAAISISQTTDALYGKLINPNT